jgi:hypothetical protein
LVAAEAVVQPTRTAVERSATVATAAPRRVRVPIGWRGVTVVLSVEHRFRPESMDNSRS